MSWPGPSSRGIRVATLDGRLLDAVPVLFDPELDVALLHVTDLRLRALPLASDRSGPRQRGRDARLSERRALTVLAAAVAGRYPATGYDIYGEDQVRREILELRAAIERGDSGGPLILADGTVGGVVFAEARPTPTSATRCRPTAVTAAIAPGARTGRRRRHGQCIN